MRKPFVFVLLLLSLWVWCNDLMDIIFFYLNYHYSFLIGNITAILLFVALFYVFNKIFFKYFYIKENIFKINILFFKELGILLLCFLPIVFLNYQRIMFPDSDSDVQAYHLFLHGLNRLQNLQNFNLVGGAGGGTYFFTLSYKIYSLFRELLGFRLGTICNTYIIFLIYLSAYDFLKQWLITSFPDKKVITLVLALSALFIILSDDVLFNLNSYKVDLIGIPLLMEMIIISLFSPLNKENKFLINVVFFTLASIIIAYKLTYLPYVLIIGLFFLLKNYKIFIKEKTLIFVCIITFLFPSIYLIYNYTQTLNPIFPFYNKFFKSPLYEFSNFKDNRWGPRNVFEFFFYSIVTFIHKGRSNENEFSSLRLLSEYVIIAASLGVVVYNRFNLNNKLKLIIYLSIVAIACNYMLLYTTGYYRYGILIEVLFGIIIVWWAYNLFFLKKWILFSLLLIFMAMQSIETIKLIYIDGINLSWYSYKELRSPEGVFLKAESKKVSNDYNTGVDSIIRNLKITAFLSCDCTGFFKLLAPNVPIYNTISFGKRQAVVDSFQLNFLDTLSQKHNLYTLIAKNNLLEKINELNTRNYIVDSMVDIYPTFTLINTPLFLVKLKHYNKDFRIINKSSSLRLDSNGVSKRFTYFSTNKFKSFIIEDPYLYNWPFRPDSSNFSVNNVVYHFDRRNTKNKIVTIKESNMLVFINSNMDLQYNIIIQALENISAN